MEVKNRKGENRNGKVFIFSVYDLCVQVLTLVVVVP